MELANTKSKATESFSKKFPSPESAEALSTAFHTMIEDGEALLKATSNYSAESLAVAREEFKNRLDLAKSRMRDVQSTVAEKRALATRATREYVSGHPLQSLALASGVGLIIGYLLRRNDE